MKGRLSENQCGMETYGGLDHLMPEEFVEREPMWDGNTSIYWLYSRISLLSENQCGMET